MNIKKIAVIGAGTMGHGIAQTYAANGYETVCIATRESSLEKAKVLVAANVKSMLEKDFITQEQADATFANMSYTTDMSSIADVDMVVEAVPEDPEKKVKIFAQLSAIVRPDCVLASTTSAMNIYKIAEAAGVKNPERVIITHWCNPPHILPLVEIVAGPNAAPEFIAEIRAQLEAMGKSPVVLKQYIPGFIINRLNLALMRECSYMVEQGWISAEDVDTAYCCNQGMKSPFEGPLEMMDYIGWDVGYGAGQLLYPAISSSVEPSKLALSMIQQGRLGVKAGKGLKDYTGREPAEIQSTHNEKVLEVVKLARKLKNL